MKILVCGSLAYDRLMDFPGKFADHLLADKLNQINVCFMVTGMTEKFGGTAGNIAYSLALLGEAPLILAACGSDFDRYEAWLVKLGLPLDGIRKIDEVITGGAYITADENENQITIFNPGSMGYPSLYAFDNVDPRDTLAIISPGNLEDMLVYSRKYKEMGIRYIFDPGQSIPAFSGEDLAEMITGSEIMISNDYELEMINQSTGLPLENLLQKTRTVITTLGEEGSVIRTTEKEIKIPAVKASRVVDPTGAGDAYRSGLLKGLVTGLDLTAAAQMGSTSASFAVEHRGPQDHRYTMEEFQARYKAAFA